MEPDTESVSSSCDAMFALSSCQRRISARCTCPSFIVGHAQNGSTTNAKTASCQCSVHINAIANVSVIAFCMNSVNVPVTASCTPFTSVDTRERISPVRVCV